MWKQLTQFVQSVVQALGPEEPLARVRYLLKTHPHVPSYKQKLHALYGGQTGTTVAAGYVMSYLTMVGCALLSGSLGWGAVLGGVGIVGYMVLNHKYDFFKNESYPPSLEQRQLVEHHIGVFCQRNPAFRGAFDHVLELWRGNQLSKWWGQELTQALTKLQRFSHLPHDVSVEEVPIMPEVDIVPPLDEPVLDKQERAKRKGWDI